MIDDTPAIQDARDRADDRLLGERDRTERTERDHHLNSRADHERDLENDPFAPNPIDLEPWQPIFERYARREAT